MKKRIVSLTSLIALLLICSICFSSCAFFGRMAQRREELIGKDSEKVTDDSSKGGNSFDDLTDADDVIQSGNEGESTNTGEQVNGGNTTIVIEGNSTDVAYAAAAGLRSSVSVLAKHGASGASTGSGIIYELDAANGSAFIITNYHVVYYNGSISSDISIFLYGMQSSDYAITASYVGGSAHYDVAVLRIEKNGILKNSAANASIAAVNIANSDDVAVGSTAIAIGAPGVEDNVAIQSIAVTSGIVSVDSEYISMPSVNGLANIEFRAIRIDAAVNSGNSGGGLFNAKGELIGIVNVKITKTDVENIAYAIPSSIVKAVTKNIIDYCYGKECKSVVRAIVGVTVGVGKLYTEFNKETGYVKPCEEIVVMQTEAGTLSDGVLLPDDVIKSVKIGDMKVEIKRMHHLIDAMLYARAGDEVVTTVIREGKEINVSMLITEEALTEY